jgi:hypothetical protein
MRTRFRWVALAILAVIGSWMLGTPSASAHTLGLSGAATCQTDGTFSIMWTNHTSGVPDGDTATLSLTAHSPVDGTVPAGALTTDLGPNEDYSFEQTGIGGDETAASVSVHIVWRGTTDFEADATGDSRRRLHELEVRLREVEVRHADRADSQLAELRRAEPERHTSDHTRSRLPRERESRSDSG